jgi:purine-nucleoside phosphorylase
MKKGFRQRVRMAVESVKETVGKRFPDDLPKVGIILGSGLGSFVESIEGDIIPYSRIRGFPEPTVEGHSGLCKIGREALVLAGRFHLYEGWQEDDVVLPVFLMAGLGLTHIVVTNASGAVNKDYSPGDLVLIKDHINLMGRNPLVGSTLEEFGPRFPDMSEAYDRELRELVQKSLPEPLEEGVYAALLGPNYETPAEIRMLRNLGADMVGMSTVPEVLSANFLSLKVLGISCITNMAAGVLDQPLDHQEVIDTGKRAAGAFKKLLQRFLEVFSKKP